VGTINYIKTPQGLIPSAEEDWELHNRFKVGALVKGEFTETRNPGFNRKFHAMINVGFEAFEPAEIDCKYGIPEKNREQFRKDVTIRAGYYILTARIDGTYAVEAKSIKFGRMKQDEFEKLYSSVANVLLRDVLTNYTKDDLDNVVNNVLSFV